LLGTPTRMKHRRTAALDAAVSWESLAREFQ